MENTTKTSNRRNILYLHVAVMLFALSGVVAQFVQIPAVIAALGRVVSSSLCLLILALIKGKHLRLDSRRDYVLIALTGMIMALHWSAFFQSIQVSSVAIGSITFSAFPLFLTFLEPLVYREKLRKSSILRAAAIFIGVLITIPEFSMDNQMTLGILWGMVSSLSYAFMPLANRYFARKYEGSLVCLYEQGTAAVVLLPALFLVDVHWRPVDMAGIVFVGVVCTALAYSLYVSAQKGVRAQTAGIISGMETVYGIVYALVLLGEVPTLRELVGGAVILAVALSSSLQKE